MVARRLLIAVLLALLLVGCSEEGDAAPTEDAGAPAAERESVPPAEERAAEQPDDARASEAGDDPAEAAQRPVRGLRLRRVGVFDSPTYVTAPAGDRRRLFVVERPGRIRIVDEGDRVRAPFLDISSDTDLEGERGLLSMAFAPDFDRSRRFYVYFTERGSGAIRIDEFRASRRQPNRAERGSRRRVLTIPHGDFSNHNGGQLQFGPDDLLYIGTGDGGGGGDPGENAQDPESLLGKLLRIDPRRRGGRPYRIPSSNPYADGGGRPEIYARGLRNPWRFSFDRRTGALVVADVGEQAIEEVTWAREGRARGTNFGWDVLEGTRPFEGDSVPGHLPPAVEHTHTSGWCSITGGYVIRDPGLGSFNGRYVYGDFCRPELRSVRLGSRGAREGRDLGISVPSLTSFGEDGRGRVHVVSLEGDVFRLVARR